MVDAVNMQNNICRCQWEITVVRAVSTVHTYAVVRSES